MTCFHFFLFLIAHIVLCETPKLDANTLSVSLDSNICLTFTSVSLWVFCSPLKTLNLPAFMQCLTLPERVTYSRLDKMGFILLESLWFTSSPTGGSPKKARATRICVLLVRLTPFFDNPTEAYP